MRPEEKYTDDILKRLIGKIPLDQPSDSFVDKVMAGILPVPETVKQKRPFFLMVRLSLPWVLLFSFFILFLVSSDIPYLGSIPGGNYLHETLWPGMISLFSGFTKLIPDGSTSSVILPVLVAGVLLIGLERLLSKKFPARHHTS